MGDLTFRLDMNKFSCCIALLFPFSLLAQQLDHHDVLLFQLKKNSTGGLEVAAPNFVTAFNPKGYNNQVKFFSDSELWLTVQTSEDTTQTDIYALDLLLKRITRVTATPLTAEYSPTPVPGGQRFSVVRVAEDHNQGLWSFPLDRSDNGRPEFPRIFNVGYHCWLSDTMVAFFIVGSNAPHSLQIAGIQSQKARKIASNIGRCLLRTSEGKLAFVQKPTQQTWFLKTWNPDNNAQDIIIKMPNGSEDFAMMADGTYLTGEGPRLYYFKPGRDNDWRELMNLTKYGVKKITRMDVAANGKLAIVVE